jgi:hypothetical protein
LTVLQIAMRSAKTLRKSDKKWKKIGSRSHFFQINMKKINKMILKTYSFTK